MPALRRYEREKQLAALKRQHREIHRNHKRNEDLARANRRNRLPKLRNH